MANGTIHSSIGEHFAQDNKRFLRTSRSPAHSAHASFYRTRTLQHLSREKKAKRVHFYRNGDRFHQGVTYAVSSSRFRTFDALLTDLTRTLADKVNLPFGVRSIFAVSDWHKIEDLNDLENGESYICSSSDSCKKMDYLRNTNPSWSQNLQSKSQSLSRLTGSRSSFNDHSRFSDERKSFKSDRNFIRPKLITVIRNGVKPRKAIRILLNKKTAHSLEQVANEITSAIKLDSGAVRKIYTLNGKEVMELSDFFGDEEVFIACGYEKLSHDDFEINGSEQKLMKSSTTPQMRRRSMKTKQQTPLVTPQTRPKSEGKLHYSKSRTTPEGIRQTTEHQNYPYNLLKKYKVCSDIGDGHFAIVKECIHRKTGERFALKIISKSKSIENGHNMENELAILHQIDHPNIVKVVQDFTSEDEVYLVMELAIGGDLFDAITSGSTYSERDASGMLYNLSCALAYLHNLNIVHRDVKPENLLLFHYTDGSKALKLGDFGLATVVEEPLFMICGTPTYVAPEIVLQKGYGLQVDVWAAGVITYILLCGSPPFQSPTNDQEELFDLIITGIFDFPSLHWDRISKSARDLIKCMLCQDQKARFTASKVLEHPWVLGDDASDQDMKILVSSSLSNNFRHTDKF